MRHRGALAAFALAALASLAPAHADIWGYLDAQGVAHFASEKLDDRYELFFRSGENFDTRTGIPAAPEPASQPAPEPEPARLPARLAAALEQSPGYRSSREHVQDAAREHGIDHELLQALIATESGFDPAAVSPKGAVGLMQVMPATAERYGVLADAKLPVARKLTDPRLNIRTGTRYLRDLIRMFPGRLELALAAYNAGEGAVQRAGNRIPNYPETQNYVRTVLQLYRLLKPPRPPAPAPAAVPNRVRMELPGPRGGAIGRGNLPARLPAAPAPALPAESAIQP